MQWHQKDGMSYLGNVDFVGRIVACGVSLLFGTNFTQFSGLFCVCVDHPPSPPICASRGSRVSLSLNQAPCNDASL